MNRKRSKFYWGIFAVILVVIGVSLYFYVPTVLGDTVYPLKYEDWIKQYSTKYNVDPALVSAVILQESKFNPNAVSSLGAQGLMQFMPSTASTMAKETGRWPNYNIFDPETSVEFGAAHLRDLLNKYSGNEDAALVAYNTGTGNTDSLIRKGILGRFTDSDDSYAKKVENYQTVYATMYSQELAVQNPVEIKKVDKSAEIRGFVWSQIFTNLLGNVSLKK